MSFSYKTLNSNDITLTSYIANKPWEVTNTTLSQNGVHIFIGENIPVNRNNPFEPNTDPKTSNQESRRLVFESIKHLYYENYTSGSLTGKFFNSSSYFNYEQSTLTSGSGISTFRNLPTITGSIINTPGGYDEIEYDVSSSIYDQTLFDQDKGSRIVVISIDREVMGSGLSPNTVYISGSGYYLKDDGEGNLYNYGNEDNYARYNSAIYNQDIYLELLNSNEPQIEYVGNVFYSHGLIVITHNDYICVFGSPPTVINDYYSYLNTTLPKTLDILDDDYSDCSSIVFDSFQTSSISEYTFPDFTYDNGLMNLTPNQSSVIPGEYKLGYTINNYSGIISNTGSINLTITSEPLEINNIVSSSTCYGSSNIVPITFSINHGVPYYSYSLDNGASYTGSNNLFNVTISDTVVSSNNNTIYVKDYLENVVTQSFTTWYPEIVYNAWVSKTNCSLSGEISISGDSSLLVSLTGYSYDYQNLPVSFSGLGTGTHNIYVKDSHNCITSSSINVTSTPSLTVNSTQGNVISYGGSNGSISSTFSNVVETLYVTLLDPSLDKIYDNKPLTDFDNLTVTAYNLTAGAYNLTVTHAGINECQSYTNTFNISQPEPLSFSISASYIDSCSNAIQFNATGGIPPYTYFAQQTPSGDVYSSDSSSIQLSNLGLNSGTFVTHILDSLNTTSISQTIDIYGRSYIYSGSTCEII